MNNQYETTQKKFTRLHWIVLFILVIFASDLSVDIGGCSSEVKIIVGAYKFLGVSVTGSFLLLILIFKKCRELWTQLTRLNLGLIFLSFCLSEMWVVSFINTGSNSDLYFRSFNQLLGDQDDQWAIESNRSSAQWYLNLECKRQGIQPENCTREWFHESDIRKTMLNDSYRTLVVRGYALAPYFFCLLGIWNYLISIQLKAKKDVTLQETSP